nr:hypothetical protein BaRGS_000269 [Batillaria attramentaria]
MGSGGQNVTSQSVLVVFCAAQPVTAALPPFLELPLRTLHLHPVEQHDTVELSDEQRADGNGRALESRVKSDAKIAAVSFLPSCQESVYH